MTTGVYDLRSALAFLIPEGVDPSAVPVVKAGESLPVGAEAAVVQGRRSLRTRNTQRLPATRYGLWAVPRGERSPRALIPDADRAAARVLLAPRATHPAPAARVLHSGVKRLPAQVLIRLGEPLLVAVAAESTVVQALRSIAPAAAIGCFLGHAENQGRSSAQAFVEGSARGIAKIVHENEGRSRVDHEAELLQALGNVPTMRNVVPRLVGRLSVPAGEVLITDAFTGEPAPLALNAAIATFLERCFLGHPRPAGRSVQIRLAGDAGIAAGHADLVGRAVAALGHEVVPTVITHGDFVPWNLLSDHGTIKAFDWEYGCLDGVPGWDALYFYIQVGVIDHHWDPIDLDLAVRHWLAARSPFWTAAGQRALAALVLLDLALRYRRRADHARARLTLGVAQAVMT